VITRGTRTYSYFFFRPKTLNAGVWPNALQTMYIALKLDAAKFTHAMFKDVLEEAIVKMATELRSVLREQEL